MAKRINGTLIFSPHADDEVLGCFGFLDSLCHVVYMGIEDRPSVSREARIAEIRLSAAQSGFTWDALHYPVNAFSAPYLIPDMERFIGEHKPSTVLLPQPSYNQDHRAVYDAGLVALRPHDLNWFVPRVLVFEQPDSLLWKHGRESEPNWFLPIDVEAKVRSYGLYASQVRGHRSPDLVRSIARLRGAQAGVEAAEGYTLKRMVSGKEAL